VGAGSHLSDINIYGEIKSGDAAKFRDMLTEFITKNPDQLLTVSLSDSPGGDVLEAMQIGDLIRESYSETIAAGDCLSACIFIYLGGVDRAILGRFGRIGIHRAFIDPTTNKTMSLKDSRENFAAVQDTVKSYLNLMGAKPELYDLMINADSTEIKFMSFSEVWTLIGTSDPAIDEWLLSKCGELDEHTKRILDITTRWTAHLVSLERGDDSPAYAEVTHDVISTYPDTFRLAFKAEDEISECRTQALVAERNKLFMSKK